MEKNRTNLITATLLVFFYLFLRGYFEFTLFYRDSAGMIPVERFRMFHLAMDMFLMFLLGLLVMVLFSGERPRKVLNTMLFGFWLVIPGPLIDYYIFGRRIGYEYIISGSNLIENAGYGLILQLVIILVMGTFYIGFKSESIKRTVVGGGLLAGVMIIGASMPLVLHRMLRPFLAWQDLDLALGLVLFAINILVVGLILGASRMQVLPAIIKRFSIARSLILVLIGIFGIVAAGRIHFLNVSYGQGSVNTGAILFCILVVLCIFFIAQSVFILESIKFEKPQKMQGNKKGRKRRTIGTLTVPQLNQLSAFMSLLSLSFGFLLGLVPFILICVIVMILWLHHFLGFKIKNEWLTGIIFYVIYALLFSTAFFVGYFTTDFIDTYIIGDFIVMYPSLSIAPPSISAILMGAIFLVIGLMLFWVINKKKMLDKPIWRRML